MSGWVTIVRVIHFWHVRHLVFINTAVLMKDIMVLTDTKIRQREIFSKNKQFVIVEQVFVLSTNGCFAQFWHPAR